MSGSARMPNAIILVPNFATENLATSRVRKFYFADIHVTDSAVKFVHLNVHLALASNCHKKTPPRRRRNNPGTVAI